MASNDHLMKQAILGLLCPSALTKIRLKLAKYITMCRIKNTFDALKSQNKKAFVAYVMGGDSDFERSLDIMKALPQAGVDIIELGMPFTDPMADGKTIQLAGQRALKSGQTLKKTLAMAAEFRQNDQETPIILMGYYNPIYVMGVDKFLNEAKKAGIDGMIIVDLPPEEDHELCLPASDMGLSFIRLATPTTDEARLPAVLTNASGFVYYVSQNGITGSADIDTKAIAPDVLRIAAKTDLPIVIGFGIKTPDAAKETAKIGDGVVVGSAIVDKIGKGESKEAILAFVQSLADKIHNHKE